MATEPTNADEVDTLENNGGDTNTDPPVRTLEETQLTNGVNEFGYAESSDIAIAIYVPNVSGKLASSNGQVRNQKINVEYDIAKD
mgnify:CR=1 FL=1